MVAAQTEELRLWVRGVRERGGAGGELVVGGAHLVQGKGIVEGGRGDVAAVEDREGAAVGV